MQIEMQPCHWHLAASLSQAFAEDTVGEHLFMLSCNELTRHTGELQAAARQALQRNYMSISSFRHHAL